MNDMNEVWKPVIGYEGLYEVSSFGRARSYRQGKPTILSSPSNSCGYPSVKLRNNGRVRTVTVHRLVALHFIPNPEELPQINHIYGNKTNNMVKI